MELGPERLNLAVMPPVDAAAPPQALRSPFQSALQATALSSSVEEREGTDLYAYCPRALSPEETQELCRTFRIAMDRTDQEKFLPMEPIICHDCPFTISHMSARGACSYRYPSQKIPHPVGAGSACDPIRLRLRRQSSSRVQPAPTGTGHRPNRTRSVLPQLAAIAAGGRYFRSSSSLERERIFSPKRRYHHCSGSKASTSSRAKETR
jgi:hypothetical protein